MKLTGIAASPGIGLGPVFRFEREELGVSEAPIAPEAAEDELARFRAALDAARRDLQRIRDSIAVDLEKIAFGKQSGPTSLGSVKGNFGHATTAAGIAGLLKAMLSLRRRRIPGTLHYRTPYPRFDFAAAPDLGAIDLAGVAAVAALLAYERWLVRPDDLSRVNVAFFQVNVVVSLGLLAFGVIDLLV